MIDSSWPPWAWNAANTALGLAALLAAGLSIYYNRKQVRLQEQKQEQEKEEAKKLKTEDEEWSRKFSRAAELVCRVGPRFYTGGPNRGAGDGLCIIFHEPEFRRQIESHLVERQGNNFRVRPISPEQLRISIIRELIERVLTRLDRFKEEESEIATRLSLM